MKSISNLLKNLNRRDFQPIPQLKKVKNLSKIILPLIIIISVVFFVQKTLAITIPGTVLQGYTDKQNAITKGNNQESWIDSSLGSNALSLSNALGGTIPEKALTGEVPFVPGGMIGLTNKSVAYLYNQPASGIEYIAQTFNDFLGKPTYAATGVGNTRLTGLIPIWKNFRNATYVLFSIFFIIIGVMIMLRVKISPQAVIAIQNSIPKIITALILITFSYAIAGLLIDASYFFTSFVLSIIGTNNLPKFMGTSLNYDIKTLTNNPPYLDIINANLLPTRILALLAGVIGGIVGGIIAIVMSVGFPINIATGAVSGILTIGLVILIVELFILIQLINFLFGMAKCYLVIILRIIFAPFEIGVGAIPNMKMGFSSWLMYIIAHLAVFPASTIFLVICNYLINAINVNSLWTPPGLEFMNFSLGSSSVISVIIGFASLLLFAKLPTMIPQFIFSIKPSEWGKALGEAASNNFILAGGAAVGKLAWDSTAHRATDAIADRIYHQNAKPKTPPKGSSIQGDRPGQSPGTQAPQEDDESIWD